MIYYSKKDTFTRFFRCVNQLIKQEKERKSLKNELTEILKNVIIKKEIDEKVDTYKKQLRSTYMKFMK